MRNPSKLVQFPIDRQEPFYGPPVPFHFTLPVVVDDRHGKKPSEPPAVSWPEHGVRVLTVAEILKSLTETGPVIKDG